MNIGINAYEANVSQRVGSNQYAYHVLVQLEKLAKNDKVTVYLASKPVKDMPKERKGWKYRVIPPAKFWTQWRLPLDLFAGVLLGRRHDVFLSLGHYAPRWCPSRSVICIMDLAYLKFPEFFKKSDVMKLKAWTGYSVTKAKHLITISEHSKKDILEHYHVPETQISVAYPGFDPQPVMKSSKAELAKLKVKEPYIVYVGTIQPRKNLVRLVKAFELLAKNKAYADVHLVVAGKVGWLAEEFTKAVQHSRYRSRIQVLGYVTDEQKLALYKHAKAAALVGLYEGFGIPPLEAMSAGTVAVVSKTSSLPEVVGDAGILVDPYSVEDIAKGLANVLDFSVQERIGILKKNREQLKKFSWENTGEIVMEVLRNVAGKGEA